jgi:hypothetical protein
MAPIALLLQATVFSPDGGLLSAGRVVLVGVVATVVVAAITATLESVELPGPPQDARPATRRAARSLFMPLVYTTMAVSRIPDPDTWSFEHRQDAGVEGFRKKIRF